MTTPIEYLKQEELRINSKGPTIAIQIDSLQKESEFWSEVQRIQQNGGWRAEEARISLGNGTLTVEQQAELDREARELIQARLEILEKRKREEEEKKQEEEKANDTYRREPILRYCIFNTERTPKLILEAFHEIQGYRTNEIDSIRNDVNRYMDTLWQDTTDERIFQRQQIQSSGGCGWTYPDVRAIFGIYHYTRETEPDYWKKMVRYEIGLPIFQKEYDNWYYYCHKFLERAKGKPKIFELQKQIEEIEIELNKVKNRNELLENKLASFRQILNQ